MRGAGEGCDCPETDRADQLAVSAQACKEGRWKGSIPEPDQQSQG